ncbi:hypothetical protein PILCRDRAFT_98772 [Piloderma croceum F 1598]|uniref:Protein kinase domain-containing protein n=1 Tax=Piloderma croceum (strain F 1598) TaxID=765440 RepID=A0A0C3EUI5_PILCF|nr:hypothetical protein PILCRDRAFT_98772 [Piloderma croceum F 1598]
MSNLHDFLEQRAKFPFPAIGDIRSAGTTNISHFHLLEGQWKAQHAVQDETLVEKLCLTLKNILAETPLTVDTENYLLGSFSPHIELNQLGGRDPDWLMNLKDAVGGSKVDYVELVDNELKVLCEAKSPSVMKKVDELLPSHGIQLKWVHGQPLVPRILAKATLYLGLRKMQWLFLSCHNYWIVCRLVRDDDHPYLAYSPEISIGGSSKPFQVFLGAILSVVKDVPVKSSPYNSDMEFDSIKEEADDGPLPENDIDDSSGLYIGSSGGRAATDHLMTHEHTRGGHENAEFKLMVTSSLPGSSEYSQAWVRLYTMANNTLILPGCAGHSKSRLWLTCFVASGSTGNIWECCFDNCDDLFAAKILNVYLILDKAHQSGQLHDRIALRCYGAFEGNGVDILILDLCNGVLNAWDELSTSECYQVYKLVQDLHSVGIVHEDLEPRNITRAHGGGFLLIDFSESRRHICRASKVQYIGTSLS